MKIEAKLALNNMRENKKRTLFTTISLILCTALILTIIILISSIRNGVSENFDTEYNDYHVIFNDLSVERFNLIKNKSYIDKIYIQKSEEAPLEKVDSSFIPQDNVTVYLKYKNIRNVCKYSNDIIKSLNLSKNELKDIDNICEFNQKLLTVYGLIDVRAEVNNSYIANCTIRVNYSYIIDLMIVTIIIAFSAFFIIILYNAFLITINERKKEYAILNSVGGTEGQVLKMVFIEAILMGVIGIIIGGVIATAIAHVILDSINNILNSAGYYFRLVLDAKYIVLAVLIIAINIYISVLIPSLKASTTSVIQGIRNNKQIKYKRKNTILEKVLPIEGKVAIKNIKRNKNKYRLITILLVISITSFIAISTYLNYEKETADIVTEYDVDAEIVFYPEYIEGVNRDYITILKEYEEEYGGKIEYMEYLIVQNNYFLIEPSDALINDNIAHLANDNKGIIMDVIALDDTTYRNYVKKLNINYGDFIIYNNIREENFVELGQEPVYTDVQVFKEGANLKISLIQINDLEGEIFNYDIIDSQILNKKIILIDEVIEGYKEIKTSGKLTLFMNKETYNELNNYIEKTYNKWQPFVNGEELGRTFWNNTETLRVKIKCDNLIGLKDFMLKKAKEQNLGFNIEFYTLENQEKIIYINIIELILKVMLRAIIIIGIISTINIMNASLCERKEDFNILYRLGATRTNIRKILIYESIYMFIKATIISLILSIPIIYGIIEQMKNIIVLNKLLIPYGEIAVFITILFAIFLAITIFSTKMIKEK